MHRSSMVLCSAALLWLPLAAHAQTDLAARPGQRVRIRIETGPLQTRTTVGTVAGVSDDSLYVRPIRGKQLIGFGASEIRSLEVSQSQKSHTVPGLLLGAGVGLALGLAARPSPLRQPDCTPPPGDIPSFDGALAMLCGVAAGTASVSVDAGRVLIPVLGTVAGGIIGALLGSRVKSDRWVPAMVPVPSASGMGLGATWSLSTRR